MPKIIHCDEERVSVQLKNNTYLEIVSNKDGVSLDFWRDGYPLPVTSWWLDWAGDLDPNCLYEEDNGEND